MGLRILKKVSSSITTTLDGELGGPIPPDFLLRIAVDSAKTSNYITAQYLLMMKYQRVLLVASILILLNTGSTQHVLR